MDRPQTASTDWVSMGIGAAGLMAPRSVAEAVAFSDARVVRGATLALGLREVAVVMGTFTQRWRRPWLWARLTGDVVGLAWLVSQLASNRGGNARLRLAAIAAVGVAVLDARAALGAGRSRIQRRGLAHLAPPKPARRDRLARTSDTTYDSKSFTNQGFGTTPDDGVE